MSKIWDFSDCAMPADSSPRKLPPGAYICKIIKAKIEDTERGPKLKLFIDIADGDYTGFFRNIYDKQHTWPFNATFIRYIKKGGFFSKSYIDLIKHIEEASPLTKIDVKNLDPDILNGLHCGFVFGEEEFKDRMNFTRTACKVKFSASIKKIKEGKCKTPPLKKLDDDQPHTQKIFNFAGEDIPDDDLPF